MSLQRVRCAANGPVVQRLFEVIAERGYVRDALRLQGMLRGIETLRAMPAPITAGHVCKALPRDDPLRLPYIGGAIARHIHEVLVPRAEDIGEWSDRLAGGGGKTAADRVLLHADAARYVGAVKEAVGADEHMRVAAVGAHRRGGLIATSVEVLVTQLQTRLRGDCSVGGPLPMLRLVRRLQARTVAAQYVVAEERGDVALLRVNVNRAKVEAANDWALPDAPAPQWQKGEQLDAMLLPPPGAEDAAARRLREDILSAELAAFMATTHVPQLPREAARASSTHVLRLRWAPFDCYYAAMALQTGPPPFAAKLTDAAQHRGLSLSVKGGLATADRDVVSLGSERELFDMVGLPYMAPCDRH
jgi:hypothetical protein